MELNILFIFHVFKARRKKKEIQHFNEKKSLQYFFFSILRQLVEIDLLYWTRNLYIHPQNVCQSHLTVICRFPSSKIIYIHVYKVLWMNEISMMTEALERKCMIYGKIIVNSFFLLFSFTVLYNIVVWIYCHVRVIILDLNGFSSAWVVFFAAESFTGCSIFLWNLKLILKIQQSK